MAGQRRLAISRLRVPNLDGFVPATAGNLLSIGAPRRWTDTEIARSHHTNQYNHRKKLKKLTILNALSVSITVDTQNVCFWIFYISILQGYTHLKRVTFSSGSSHWTLSDRNMIDLVIFRAYWLKTTYMLECPVRVDWQSPACESQILMVLSALPLAICFPSGLHATE